MDERPNLDQVTKDHFIGTVANSFDFTSHSLPEHKDAHCQEPSLTALVKSSGHDISVVNGLIHVPQAHPILPL